MNTAFEACVALWELRGILRVKAGIPRKEWEVDDELGTPAHSGTEPGKTG